MIQVIDGNADNLLIKWSFKLSSIIIQLSFFYRFLILTYMTTFSNQVSACYNR